jgi:hypothetical protein
MKTMMMKVAAVLATALATMMVGCSADEVGSDSEPEQEVVASTEQAQIKGGGGTTKTKAGLEADGYTCTALSGTTVTLCWKNGSPGYTCNDRGTCTQSLTRNPIPVYEPPVGGVFVAP